MMETKLWTALCAILVIHLGSASPDNNRTTALPSIKTGLVLDPVPSSTNHSLQIPDTDPRSNGTGGLNSSTTSASITITLEPRKNNAVTNATTTNNESITHSVPSPSQSHTTTPVPSHTSTTHVTQTPSFLNTSVTPTPSSNQNVSQPQNISDRHSQTTAPPASSNLTSEPPKPASTTITTTTTTTTTTKSNTSSTSSSQNPTTSQLTNTSQSNRQSSTTQPNSQANSNSHTNDPLPLNAEDTTKARDSAALDPLLAGLVSAFIIAAVIITLLLFLKLRRRGNRPEFRRLQDLPMDDMEDTPLSMYSY